MAQVVFKHGTQRDGIIPCPMCRGKQYRVNPFAQKNDPRCSFCAGIGAIDRDHTCICGRVLRLDEKGRVVANIFCCGRDECRKKMYPQAPEKKQEVVPVTNLREDDDEGWWDDYRFGHNMPTSDRRWLAEVYQRRRGYEGD